MEIDAANLQQNFHVKMKIWYLCRCRSFASNLLPIYLIPGYIVSRFKYVREHGKPHKRQKIKIHLINRSITFFLYCKKSNSPMPTWISIESLSLSLKTRAEKLHRSWAKTIELNCYDNENYHQVNVEHMRNPISSLFSSHQDYVSSTYRIAIFSNQ